MKDEINDNLKRQSIKSVDLESFLRDTPFAKITRRAEKITAALYLVTSLLPDVEPMQSHMRQHALIMVEEITLHNDDQSEQGIAKIMLHIRHLLGLLETSLQANLMSAMNVIILQKELQMLQRGIEEIILYKDNYPEQDYLQGRVHERVQKLLASESGQGFQKEINQNDINDNKMSFIKNDVYNVVNKTFKTTIKDKPKLGDTSGRQNLILSIIKEKGKATMKDIAMRITNCSEKTLQRDLMSLIDQGVVLKKGSKRWSLYEII